jgi:D-alanine-D-alanine ligase
MNVGLCFNLKKTREDSLPDDLYAEWDDEETIEAVRSALSEKHRVMLIEGNEEAFEKFRRLRPDIVFNMAEGLHGASREAQIPSLLEMLRIPYTGSDPLTLALGLDKSLTKEILSYHGIPTPRFTVVTERKKRMDVPPFPLIVKPLFEGSSKGVGNNALVRTPRQLQTQVSLILQQYHQPSLVEQYLPGREFTVALLGNGDAVHVLPVVEIAFDQLPGEMNPIYSYEAKWIWDTVEKPLEIFSCPAKVPATLRKKIESVCRSAFAALRCRDWCRIDVRLDAAGEPNILELNPLPGILPNPDANSCFPKAARTAGISYSELINQVLEIACQRVGLKP